MNPLEALNWQKADLEQRDESFRIMEGLGLVEIRPVPEEMTDTERLDWFGEYCNLGKSHYQDETPTTNGKFVLYDFFDQETKENSFRDAIDTAMQKWKEANS